MEENSGELHKSKQTLKLVWMVWIAKEWLEVNMESSGEFQEMNVDAGLESWTNPSWTFSQPTAALNSNEIHTELFFRPHLS